MRYIIVASSFGWLYFCVIAACGGPVVLYYGMIAIECLLELLPPALLSDLAVQYKLDDSHEIRLTGDTAFVCMLNNLMNDPLLTQRLPEEQFVKQTGRSIDHSPFGRWLSRPDPALFPAAFRHLYIKLARPATHALTPPSRPPLSH